MKKNFILILFSLFILGNTNAQNVGIGTKTPLARLHVTDSSVLFSAAGDIPLTATNTPISGGGRRMMWYPAKAAFRAGYVDGVEWDMNNIGNYSVALGYGVTASGYASTALGEFNTASGQNSTAMGINTIASGAASTAMGYNTTASGEFSIAIGSYVTTNSQSGACIIGDDGSGRSSTVYYNNSPNSMQMVFAGGYKLYTGSSSSGVYMNGGDNSWSAVSDSTKKEKIMPVDGEGFLNKIAQFKLSTWNYKGQDSKTFRHYGPMAQDFYNAFGKDALGNIGCDTLINQQDFLGVSFIAIQALEKRTEEIEQQQKQINDLQKQNVMQQQKVDELQQNNIALQQQMQTLLNTVAALNKQVQTLAVKTNNQNTVAVSK